MVGWVYYKRRDIISTVLIMSATLSESILGRDVRFCFIVRKESLASSDFDEA